MGRIQIINSMSSEKSRNKEIKNSKKLLAIGIIAVVVLMSFATLFNFAAASLITNDLSLAGFEVTESVVPFGSWATDMFHSRRKASLQK